MVLLVSLQLVSERSTMKKEALGVMVSEVVLTRRNGRSEQLFWCAKEQRENA